MSFITISHSVHGIPSNKVYKPLLLYLLDISPTQSVWKSKEMHSKTRKWWYFPKMVGRDPKREKRRLFSSFSHFYLWYRGDKNGNPLKVNISWFMVIFSEFHVPDKCLHLGIGQCWLIWHAMSWVMDFKSSDLCSTLMSRSLRVVTAEEKSWRPRCFNHWLRKKKQMIYVVDAHK